MHITMNTKREQMVKDVETLLNKAVKGKKDATRISINKGITDLDFLDKELRAPKEIREYLVIQDDVGDVYGECLYNPLTARRDIFNLIADNLGNHLVGICAGSNTFLSIQLK